MKRSLLINGSPMGRRSNSAKSLQLVDQILTSKECPTTTLHLADDWEASEVEELLERSDTAVFATGTYWDSWGSPLQRFLEVMTYTEGKACWLGKPVAVIVSMHAVGGKGVLSRLQGVLNCYGALIPPMSGVVLSLVNQLAIANSDHPLTEDLWRNSDLEIVIENLWAAAQRNRGTSEVVPWKAWPTDRDHVNSRWLESS